MILQDYIKYDKNNICLLSIKVTPKANKTEFFSVLENWTLKIRLKAVPEDWKANKELIKFLSKELNINKNNIEIVSWKTDQLKKIKIIRNIK